MDWVSNRDDAEPLLVDLHRPHQSAPDLTLVNGLIAHQPTPHSAPADWPLPHVTRHARNDFRYEFSLSASPEFDTDSADAHAIPRIPDDDDASTDLRGATSEDTSLGAGGVGTPVPSSSQQQQQQQQQQQLKQEQHIVDGEHTSNSPAVSPSRPLKTISKRKSSTAKKTARSAATRSVASHATVNVNGTPSAGGTSAGGAGGGGSAAQSGALSHTKMCRDRLNNMFEKLRHTLPPAPPGVEVKHKAQVLDYAIGVLKDMVERTSQLEIELAVSSNKATMDWISKLVDKVDSFADAAEQVMRLFARRRGWKHSELWIATKRPTKQNADPEQSILLTFNRFVVNEAMVSPGDVNLAMFSKESESYAFRAKQGVQGRVWSSMRPEWVTGLSDAKNFHRATLARKYGLKVCLAFPITVTGKIEAVMCFYDTKHRPYDTQCLELGLRLAWALGNAVGGKRAKVNVLSTSGTSNT